MNLRRALLAAVVGASVAAAPPVPAAAATSGACTSASMSPDTASPQPVGMVNAVAFTATSTTCATPEYRFFLQKPGGAWIAKTTYGGATWRWNTVGLVGGVYGVEVWARQTGSTARYEASWTGTYTLSVRTCTVAGISTNGLVQRNSTASFWGGGSNCPNPEVRFWFKRPGGAWKMVRDWGGNPWTWNTTGYPDGVYEVGVWARQKGSPNRYDAYAWQSFQLGMTGGCWSGFLGAQESQPQVPGTTLHITAGANCQALFEFWLKPPGGAWRVVLPYSTNNLVSWDTTGYAQGLYEVGVWTKPAGGWPSKYLSYGIITYQLLNAEPCTGVSITASPASPQVPGTSLTFTVAPTSPPDCGAPTFEFWLKPSAAASWVIVQPYGTGTTFTLDTTGAPPGPIQVGVWSRQTGRTNPYDTYAIVTYWLGA